MHELIYVVEDDESIRELLKCALESFSYSVKSFGNAEDMLKTCREILPRLILLDIMLPNMSGLEALSRLKENHFTESVPVIMLTAKSSEVDKVSGLDKGADDYITKPFGVLELTARVRAALRRSEKGARKCPDIISHGDITVDNVRHTVTAGGERIELTIKEFELLKILLLNHGNVMERDALINLVWGYDFLGESRTLDMHIKTLRKKLKDDASFPKYIKTIRGIGYIIE